MHFYRYATNYEGELLPVQLLVSSAFLLIWLSVLFAAINLIQRSFRVSRNIDENTVETSSKKSLLRYPIGARLYHWGGSFLMIVVLSVSGVALFAPGTIAPLPISWLRIHEIAAGCFILALLLHIIASLLHGEAKAMWFEGNDWRDLVHIGRAIFNYRVYYPKFGKYDVLQKSYHALLAFISFSIIGTGTSMFLNTEIVVSLDHDWMRWQRMIHDTSAFILIALVLAHAYLRLLKSNWPTVAAMFTGRISEGYFWRIHSSERWRPRNVSD